MHNKLLLLKQRLRDFCACRRATFSHKNCYAFASAEQGVRPTIIVEILMTIFQRLLFIINKPLVLYMFSPLIFLEFGARSVVEKAGILTAFIATFAIIIFIEKIMKSRIYTYKSVMDIDEIKVIEIAGRYLNRDYSGVHVFKKSIRGKFVRRGFEEEFHIKVKDGLFRVAINGSFPFPISLINRANIIGDIETELRSHKVLRA